MIIEPSPVYRPPVPVPYKEKEKEITNPPSRLEWFCAGFCAGLYASLFVFRYCRSEMEKTM